MKLRSRREESDFFFTDLKELGHQIEVKLAKPDRKKVEKALDKRSIKKIFGKSNNQPINWDMKIDPNSNDNQDYISKVSPDGNNRYNDLKEFDVMQEENKEEYLDYKVDNDYFYEKFEQQRKLREHLTKRSEEREIEILLENLIDDYLSKGYKIPSFGSLQHNIFKVSGLIMGESEIETYIKRIGIAPSFFKEDRYLQKLRVLAENKSIENKGDENEIKEAKVDDEEEEEEIHYKNEEDEEDLNKEKPIDEAEKKKAELRRIASDFSDEKIQEILEKPDSEIWKEMGANKAYNDRIRVFLKRGANLENLIEEKSRKANEADQLNQTILENIEQMNELESTNTKLKHKPAKKGLYRSTSLIDVNSTVNTRKLMNTNFQTPQNGNGTFRFSKISNFSVEKDKNQESGLVLPVIKQGVRRISNFSEVAKIGKKRDTISFINFKPISNLIETGTKSKFFSPLSNQSQEKKNEGPLIKSTLSNAGGKTLNQRFSSDYKEYNKKAFINLKEDTEGNNNNTIVDIASAKKQFELNEQLKKEKRLKKNFKKNKEENLASLKPPVLQQSNSIERSKGNENQETDPALITQTLGFKKSSILDGNVVNNRRVNDEKNINYSYFRKIKNIKDKEELEKNKENYLEYCYRKINSKDYNNFIDSDIVNYFNLFHGTDKKEFLDSVSKYKQEDLFKDIRSFKRKTEDFNIPSVYKNFSSAYGMRGGEFELELDLVKDAENIDTKVKTQDRQYVRLLNKV